MTIHISFPEEEEEFSFTELVRYAQKYDRHVRHPLIIGNPDWDGIINVLLSEWGSVFDKVRADIDRLNPMLSDGLLMNLRIILEIIYYLGYQNGLKTRGGHTGSMTFIVKEKEE